MAKPGKGGSSDFVASLAKRPPQQQLAILGAVLAVLGLLYWQFFYSSAKSERDDLGRRKANLIKKGKDLDKKITEKKKLKEKYEELQSKRRANEKALPTQAELPAFFDHLQRKAGEASVSIKRWDRKKEQSIEGYMKVPVEIEIAGNFYQIKKYFSLLGPPPEKPKSLAPPAPDKPADDKAAAKDDKNKAKAKQDDKKDECDEDVEINERIVSIENLFLGDSAVRNEEIILTARFLASTFRQADGAATAARVQPKAPSGGKVGAARAQTDAKVEKAATADQAPAGGAKK